MSNPEVQECIKGIQQGDEAFQIICLKKLIDLNPELTKTEKKEIVTLGLKDLLDLSSSSNESSILALKNISNLISVAHKDNGNQIWQKTISLINSSEAAECISISLTILKKLAKKEPTFFEKACGFFPQAFEKIRNVEAPDVNQSFLGFVEQLMEKDQFVFSLSQNSTFVSHAIRYLSNQNQIIVASALRVLSFVSSVNLEPFLKEKESILEKLQSLLDSDDLKIQKDTCWVLSNFASDSPESLVDTGIIPKFSKIFKSCNNIETNNQEINYYDVHKEAGWVLYKLIINSKPESIPGLILVENKGLATLESLLDILDKNETEEEPVLLHFSIFLSNSLIFYSFSSKKSKRLNSLPYNSLPSY